MFCTAFSVQPLVNIDGTRPMLILSRTIQNIVKNLSITVRRALYVASQFSFECNIFQLIMFKCAMLLKAKK